MSIAAMPMAVRSISEPGATVQKVRRPPRRRQAIALADDRMRPEPR